LVAVEGVFILKRNAPLAIGRTRGDRREFLDIFDVSLSLMF